MDELHLDGAAWIWLPAAPDSLAPNTFVAFRRTIDVAGGAAYATVRITADARYELYVNGTWVGHGPPRSFLSPWPVDSYDVSHLLHSGENVVAVLVQHIGVGTFQYIDSVPGLLADVRWHDGQGEHDAVTDDAWRCRRHEGFAAVVPRISCQLAWEEQFDARAEPGSDWIAVTFDDAGWDAAAVVRAAGVAPHESFELRDIPFLTREPVYPGLLLRADVVRPAPYTWSLNPRDYLNATDRSANFLIGRMFLTTYIHSDHEQAVELHVPHGTPGEWKLNGERLKFDDHAQQSTDAGVAHAALRAGWNALLVRLPESRHLWTAVINLWTDEPVTIRARPDAAEPSSWLALGPFAGGPSPADRPRLRLSIYVEPETIAPGATAAVWDSIWERGELAGADLSADWARPLLPYMVSAADVFAISSSERVLVGVSPRIDEPRAIAEDTADWTTIHPSDSGGDVRLLLDYGQEIVGNHEFEIDAPDGAIVDFHDFEFIQRDGRVNLCEGMNNSLRYVCREGYQSYRTFVRHGLRYSYMSLRNFDRPLRLRAVRVLQSTYPPAQQGSFDCSDALLTRIWSVGAHSVRCCAEDTYTDCPTYEQTHWVGDARNEALVDLIANGDPRLSRHCWIQAGRSLDRSSLVEAQVPSSWLTILPAWSFLWMRWAHEHYMLTGDAHFGAEALTFLQRNIDGIEEHLDDRELFQINAWNMFDWAPMDTPHDGIVTHQICLAVLGLRQAAELAHMLYRHDKAAAWNGVADRMAGAVNHYLWSEERQAYLDCIRFDGAPSPIFSQQTQTAAFISGVAVGERAARCRAIIESAPEGFVEAGSPFFMFFVLEMLVKEGAYGRMVQAIRDYWGIQVEAGATTYWEMYYPNRERHTRSHCHGWSAAPTYFLSQHVLGVQPLTAGYETILVRPRIADLRWTQGRVPTPAGNVAVYWRRSAVGEGGGEGERFELQLSWPSDVEMRVELPFAGAVDVAEGQMDPVEGDVEGRSFSAGSSGRLRVTVDG